LYLPAVQSPRFQTAPFIRQALLAAPLLALSLALTVAQPAAARETVLEDTPSRLVLEVEVPDYSVLASAAPDAQGTRVVNAGYANSGAAGAPDLPWLRFQVATGDRMPRVSVEPLQWVEVNVPGGLAGVPRWVTTRQSESVRDEALFAAGRGLNPGISDVQPTRGLGLRTVSLPLGTYAGGASVTMLKKFRLRVEFPNPSGSPAAGVKPWLEFAGVKNTSGGQYLASLPRPQALPRSAASSRAAALDSLAPRLRLSVGDRTLDVLDEDGVYALTYTQAVAAGMPAAVDLRRLRLFAGPKDTLRIRMDSLVAPTLREIPLEVRDANANNTFDAGDTLLFYAHGTSIWMPIANASGPVRWEFKNDPWSFENRYYLQWTGPETGALRIPTAASVVTADTTTVAPHYVRGERDLMTGSCDPSGVWDPETGYVWHWYKKFVCSYSTAPGFGETTPLLSWNQLRRPMTDSLSGRASDTVRYGFFTYRGPIQNWYRVLSGATEYPYDTTVQTGGAWYVNAAAGPGNTTGIESVEWGGSPLDPRPRFEGYTIRYTRSLRYRDGENTVFPARSGTAVAYKVEGAPAGMRVLRIESGVGARWLTVVQSGGTARFADVAADGEDVRYLLVGGTYLAPAGGALTLEAPTTTAGVIQGLRDGSIGGARQNPEYLIIAPQALLAEALKLAEYRNDPEFGRAWSTSVVRVEDIYREWSGGRLSPVAIRDFLRWAVNRWGAGNAMGNLKHVLLFGDGHYDYRNIIGGGPNSSSPNHIPPFNWQTSDNSGDPMSTDDFYGVIDSGSTWFGRAPTLSIGRLSFKTREQASAYLEKISRYENPSTAGAWRNRYLITADDQTQRNNPFGNDNVCCHTDQSEVIGQRITAQDSGARLEKIYLMDYQHNASYLKPEATNDLLNQYNRGVLFSTFYGHGAYNQMADEVLLKTNDGVSRFRNVDKNFLMTIFSCTVGRFDKLADEGMSEQFITMKDYGAISAISATRESFPTENFSLGQAFVQRALGPNPDSAGLVVGDALRLAKVSVTNFSNLNNQKYVLQGEPVLALTRPGVGLTLDSRPDSLQALGCGTISGRVTRGSGKGAVSLRMVSGDVPKTYTRQYSGATYAMPPVDKRGQILFETTLPYTDSTFSIPYFLPKQVPFGDTKAKIQVFAWDSLELRESSLLVRNLSISGTDTTGNCMVDDKRGPRILVTGCNTAETGGADFPDKVKIGLPYCLQVSVSDSGGGVLAGEGPEQATTVEVIGSIAPFQPQAGVDELYGKTYQVPLSAQELAPGTHLLKVSARDGFGNLTQRQVSLQVTSDTTLRFVRAFNTPNPLKSGKTTFWFSTSLPVEEGQDLTSPNVDRVRFHLKIFNQLGYMVREFRDARSGETQWDGRDAWGRQMANGVYFFEVTATWDETNGSPAGGRSASKKNVLVISR